jgi:hypothetical protein
VLTQGARGECIEMDCNSCSSNASISCRHLCLIWRLANHIVDRMNRSLQLLPQRLVHHLLSLHWSLALEHVRRQEADLAACSRHCASGKAACKALHHERGGLEHDENQNASSRRQKGGCESHSATSATHKQARQRQQQRQQRQKNESVPWCECWMQPDFDYPSRHSFENPR